VKTPAAAHFERVAINLTTVLSTQSYTGQFKKLFLSLSKYIQNNDERMHAKFSFFSL